MAKAVPFTIACYECGNLFEKPDITKEHIPPRCFSDVYPLEFKKDRITVPCCKKCNTEYGKIDHELRDYIALLKDGSDNPDFLKKAIGSITRNKVLGKDFQFVNGGVEVAFEYAHIEQLFTKCHKGLYYDKYDQPIDNLFDTQASQKMINEAHDSQINFLFEKLHKSNPTTLISSGHPDIFKASMLGFNVGDGNYKIVDNPNADIISTYMEFHGIIDCMVLSVNKESAMHDIIKGAL